MSSIIIGNSYRRIPDHEAPFDRSGQFRKVHDWTVFVDVVVRQGEHPDALEDAIDRVSFDLGSSFHGNPFLCRSPVPLMAHGRRVWRFSTRQKAYGFVTAQIQVRGAGGKVANFMHEIVPDNENSQSYSFAEARGPRPLRMVALPSEQQFGVELECTTNVGLDAIVRALPVPCALVGNHAEGRRTMDTWKIVPDGSIVCNRSMPDCNTFELVSPVLTGGTGLSQISTVCRALKQSGSIIKINKSMGFHVHINVEHLSLNQLIKICQQFIKYEQVFDSFMPPSRRTGSAESNRYFQSNRDSIGGFLTNKQRNQALANCTSLGELCQLMNAGDSRYYKLNLQNLRLGRQPTLEFRQHSATINYEKIAAWVRLCAHFCQNAATLKAPVPFAADTDSQERFQALFWYVIKDRSLRDFYAKRREQVNQGGNGEEEEDSYCCGGCANGGACHSGGVARAISSRA